MVQWTSGTSQLQGYAAAKSTLSGADNSKHGGKIGDVAVISTELGIPRLP